MKMGRDLVDLAKELQRRRESAKDYVADTRNMRAYAVDQGDVQFQLGDDQQFEVQPFAHGQVATHIGVPKPYYDRMLAEAPDLLVRNVNHWLQERPAKRMVRTLDGTMRAFLSDSFRRLDNYDFMEAALPPLVQAGVEVMSCEVTDRRLYLKVVDKRITRDIPGGGRMGDGGHTIFHTVSPALVLSNSEVGDGALSVKTSIFEKVCTNLSVFKERSTRTRHLGARIDAGDELYKLLSDETIRKTDEAIFAQVGDVVRNAFNEIQFEALCDKLANAGRDAIVTSDPGKVIDVTAKRFGLLENEKAGILGHLIAGGELTRYGLHAAITRAAEDVESYDRASMLEQVGGDVIDLEPTQWREMAREWRQAA